MRFRPTRLLLACSVLWLAACGAESRSTSGPPATPAETQPAPPKILHFYVSPGAVTLGQQTTLCYGVENADTVVLEPNLKAIKPGLNRCFAFAPKKAGIIKFTAAGPGGEAHEELAIGVLPAARAEESNKSDLITVFVASQDAVAKGMPVTLCYAVEEADSVEIDPPVLKLEPAARCFTTRVDQTTTYKITATNGARIQSKSLEIQVR